MVRIPTIAEEDAKRPNRERECLVKERTRLDEFIAKPEEWHDNLCAVVSLGSLRLPEDPTAKTPETL